MTEVANSPTTPATHRAYAPPATRLFVPDTGAYSEDLMVRSYETGPGDIVRPSTLLRYMEYLATRHSAALGYGHAWYEERGEAFVVREMRLHVASPARMDQMLTCATWVADWKKVQAIRDYAIWHADTGQPVARASARWAYIDLSSGRPRRIPEAVAGNIGTHGHELRPNPRLPRWLDASGADNSATVTPIVARDHEADTRTHINNCVYADWLEDAATEALRGQGLDAEHYRAREYTIDYMQQAWPGDRMTLSTRLSWPTPRVVIARQEITTESGAAVVRAIAVYLRLLACPAPENAERVG